MDPSHETPFSPQSRAWSSKERIIQAIADGIAHGLRPLVNDQPTTCCRPATFWVVLSDDYHSDCHAALIDNQEGHAR